MPFIAEPRKLAAKGLRFNVYIPPQIKNNPRSPSPPSCPASGWMNSQGSKQLGVVFGRAFARRCVCSECYSGWWSTCTCSECTNMSAVDPDTFLLPSRHIWPCVGARFNQRKPALTCLRPPSYLLSPTLIASSLHSVRSVNSYLWPFFPHVHLPATLSTSPSHRCGGAVTR